MSTHKDLEERLAQDFVYGDFVPSEINDSNESVLLPFFSDESKKRLFSSTTAEPFFRLANFYQPQINPVYCGIASAVIVMNALTQPRNQAPFQEELTLTIPTNGKTIHFPAHTQLSFLNESTEKIKKKSVIEYREKNSDGTYKPGLSISELTALIQDHGFQADFSYSRDSAVADGIKFFRKCLKENFKKTQPYFIIHFRSDLLGGVSRGHISPIAAYHEASDSVLVLDVAGHKTPWYWAPLGLLFRAMAFQYDTQPKGGGLISVRLPS